MKTCVALFAVLLLLVALSATAMADPASTACRGKIVKVGDSKAKILTACGKPLQKTYVTEKNNPWWKIWSKKDTTVVEKWVYHMESCGMRTLTFQGITLIKIEKGDRL